jgi:hypothetical protein
MIARAVILAGLLCLCVSIAVLVLLTPDRLTQVKPGMTAEHVDSIMGTPASIEQSESADQTVNGEVNHYPARFPSVAGDCRVIFVNHIVFNTKFIPQKKS